MIASQYQCQGCGYRFKRDHPGPVICKRCGCIYVTWLNFKQVLQDYWHERSAAEGWEDRIILEEIKELLGVGNIYLLANQKVYQLGFYSQDAQNIFIDAVEPYVRIKRLQLILAKKWLKCSSLTGVSLNQSKRDTRQQIHEVMSMLNHNITKASLEQRQVISKIIESFGGEPHAV